jgi:hypothetical protein
VRGLFVGATLLLLANSARAQGLIVGASGGLPVGFPGSDAGIGAGGRVGWEFATGVTPSLRVDYVHWNMGFRGTDFVAVVSTLVDADYRVPLDGPWRPWLGLYGGWAHHYGRIWGNDESAERAEISLGGGADYALSRHFLVGGGVRFSAVLTEGEFEWVDFSAALSTTW